LSLGRTIRVYLDNGQITGIKHAEIVNWTGQAISCPRTLVKSLSDWPESLRPGVYFLFGIDQDTEKNAIYIGEAENVLERLQNHLKNKDFWNEVIFFTSKDDNLTKSHVKYLESSLVQLANLANRYTVLNGNAPSKSSLPRGDRDSMEEFIENIRVLLGVLGHKALEQLVPNKIEKDYFSNEEIKEKFYLKVKNIEAESILTNEGVIVLAGSKVSQKIKKSLSDGYVKLRNKLIDSGVIQAQNDELVFKENQLFTSASQSASIIVGYTINGRYHWQNKNGTTMKQYEEEKNV